MKIQTNKTQLWRLARDYGAQPPALKRTALICYESGSYGLTWPGGPRVYLAAVVGRPVLLIGEDSHRLTVDELRRRGMVSEGRRERCGTSCGGAGRGCTRPWSG